MRDRERNVENSEQDHFIILTRILALKKRLWKNYKENEVIHAVICEVIPQVLFSPRLVLLVGAGTLNSASVAFHVLNVPNGFGEHQTSPQMHHPNMKPVGRLSTLKSHVSGLRGRTGVSVLA